MSIQMIFSFTCFYGTKQPLTDIIRSYLNNSKGVKNNLENSLARCQGSVGMTETILCLRFYLVPEMLHIRKFSGDESTTSSSSNYSYSDEGEAVARPSLAPSQPKIEHITPLGHMSWAHIARQSSIPSVHQDIAHIYPSVSTPEVVPTAPVDHETLDVPTAPVDYGVHGVIKNGSWNLKHHEDMVPPPYSQIEPPRYLQPPPAYATRADDSIVQLGEESRDEFDPLVKGLKKCKSCSRRFTSRTRTNYWTILFLVIAAFCLLLSFFPWGILGLVVLSCIPAQFNRPTCKKCQRKCC